MPLCLRGSSLNNDTLQPSRKSIRVFLLFFCACREHNTAPTIFTLVVSFFLFQAASIFKVCREDSQAKLK